MGASAAWVAIAALALLLLLVAFYATRVRALGQRVGSFECALRRPGQEGWTSGIAVFGAGRLDWYRLISLSNRPARTFRRRELVLAGRRGRGQTAAGGRVIEVTCRYRGEDFELGMVDQAFAGLVSWLEAAPPSEGQP